MLCLKCTQISCGHVQQLCISTCHTLHTVSGHGQGNHLPTNSGTGVHCHYTTHEIHHQASLLTVEPATSLSAARLIYKLQDNEIADAPLGRACTKCTRVCTLCLQTLAHRPLATVQPKIKQCHQMSHKEGCSRCGTGLQHCLLLLACCTCCTTTVHRAYAPAPMVLSEGI